MSNEEIFTLIRMRNGGLFLHIHEGVQASQRLKKLTSTSLEHRITAARTRSKIRKTGRIQVQKTTLGGANREKKYGRPDEYKCRKQHYGGAKRAQMVAKSHGG